MRLRWDWDEIEMRLRWDWDEIEMRFYSYQQGSVQLFF
jgi:hypothetical protein